MKLYNSMGPNPKVVRMFIAEKGLDIPVQEVDLIGGENRRPPYSEKVNIAGQIPALELDDGTMLGEVTAICEYLDATSPGPSLIGDTEEERAQTRMMMRRVDLNICEPMGNGFRWSDGLQLFKERMICLPEAADGMKRIAQDRLTWLDPQLEGRTWLAGERFTLADILLFAFLDFFAGMGQPINPDNKNIAAWYERVKARPSAEA